MKKKNFYVAALVLGLAFVTTSCSSDDDDTFDPANIEYNSSNASSWHNYMRNVAQLLKNDATSLYESWNTSYNEEASYASIFKTHNNSTYGSAWNCVEEIIDGCIDIASEVGDAKIGDPYDLYTSGRTTEALYAVESWYSWHSRDDYTNNIYSIRNSYYGSLDGSVNAQSIAALIAEKAPSLDGKVRSAISTAASAIQNIPQPFRNNINSDEARAAMDACSDLEDVLNELKTYIGNTNEINDDNTLSPIVVNYVDVVVLPTYKSLMELNTVLYNAVIAISNNPSNATFEAACKAWLSAREPWEKSEAFLFGPVDALGLDPNMDSWPLDQSAIVQILNSGNFDDLNWGDNDDDDAIEAAQNVRGFHTLEFLLFKDGTPRIVE